MNKVRLIEKHEHIDKLKSQFSTKILGRLPVSPKVLLVYLPCKKQGQRNSRFSQKEVESPQSSIIWLIRRMCLAENNL